MLHQASFSHETKQNLYFVNSSPKRIEHAENTAVTVNPINSFKSELDMSSNIIYVAEDNAPNHMNMSNVGTTEVPTSFRKSDCLDHLDVDCENDIATQFPNVTFDERQSSSQLINMSNLEICRASDCQPTRDYANILSLNTGQKPDLLMDEVAAGYSVTETGTTLLLHSPKNARHVLRDIPVDEGTSSKDKLPIATDSSVAIEELVKFKTSLENKMKFHKHALETIADHLKMIEVKDIQDIPEGQGSTFDVKGLKKEILTHQDDKGILEESFIFHFSSLEEKHVCNPLHGEQNTEKQEISIKSDCITELSCFALDKTGDMENPGEDDEKDKIPAIVSSDKMESFKTFAEDAEKDRESAIVSMDSMEDLKCSMEDGEKDREYAIVCEYHEKPILSVPTNNERYNGHASDAFHFADCLDVRLESSSSRTHFSHHSPVETVMRVPIAVTNDSRAESLGCGADSEDCFASHDIHAGESSGIAPDESHSIASSALNGQNSNDNFEYASIGTTKRGSSNKTLCIIEDNIQRQKNPFLVSEKLHTAAVNGLNVIAIINSSSSNMELTGDDLVSKGCSDGGTESLEMKKLDTLQDSFKRNLDIDQKEPRVHAVEDKSTLDSGSSPVLSHTLQESNKMYYLKENNSSDTDTKIYDTSKESTEDNIPACRVVNVNAALNGDKDSQIHDIKPGCSTHQVFQEKTEESVVASEQNLTVGQNVSSLTCLTKEGDGPCEISEKLLFDSVETDSSPLQKSVGHNVSAPAFVDNDMKRNVKQRSAVSSGCTGHPVSSLHTGQELLETFPEASDEVNGYSDMAESDRYTYSGPISGPIAYSGPIPFSGSISIRSDSSTTSTRSFAFPILASEWSSSPVKMTQADPRYYRKKRGWHFLCFCGGASATS